MSKHEYIINLENYAKEVDAKWGSNESVDWSEAESLVRLVKKAHRIAAHESKLYSVLNNIIMHTRNFEDWDSGEVGNWPTLIIEAI